MPSTDYASLNDSVMNIVRNISNNKQMQIFYEFLLKV